jgi:epoxyqueuosine reductase
MDLPQLAAQIRSWGAELGFQQIGVAGIALDDAEARLDEWVARGLHGELDYMTRHGRKRTRPGDLLPGTTRVISARMDYLPDAAAPAATVLQDGERAYIARYALGRDYHKLLRQRLKHLAERIRAAGAPHGYRVFVDSAPVLEKPLAAAAGLGWQGKHTNLINRQAGSWFLLGEIYTDLPLPLDEPVSDHCGSCHACLDVCPTGAIVAPYLLDARRCISYFTIESRGPIPPEFRTAMGNRIFGCDDCQLVCPWNRYARATAEPDFAPRHGLDAARLTDLFGWSEQEWSARTAGSALRRPGYDGWLRNIAVALGNAPSSPGVMEALGSRAGHASELVREHVAWALEQHAARRNGP